MDTVKRRILDPERTVLIACSMMEDEIQKVIDQEKIHYPVIWMERGYHEKPDRLRAILQEQIDLAEERFADADPRARKASEAQEVSEASGTPGAPEASEDSEEKPVILLGYGLCGNGAAGLKTRSAVLAMPRFDDCINTILCCGPRTRRSLEKAGVYYLTRTWTLDTGALLQSHQKMLAKYGKRRTGQIMQMMYDGYRQVSVIDDGCYDKAPVISYADQCAALLGVERGEVPGSTRILRKLLTGDWDEAEILVKKPDTPVTQWTLTCPIF